MSLSPLELPGWLEFNTWRTGLKAQHFVAGQENGTQVRAVLYLNPRGRVRLPSLNPYLPVVFHSERQGRSSRTAEWLREAEPLVEEMARRGVPNAITLPPGVDDVRPWLWHGFLVGVRYTYLIDFPYDPAATRRTQRQHASKAAALGMTVERVTDPRPVLVCLAETETRKGFVHGITARDLTTAQHLLGADSLRMYVCFDAAGRPAAARVIIHSPGTIAIAWMAGTRSGQLPGGANPLLWARSLSDIADSGARGIDLHGANLQSVAAFKSEWDSRLVPVHSLRTQSARMAGRFLADWLSATWPMRHSSVRDNE